MDGEFTIYLGKFYVSGVSKRVYDYRSGKTYNGVPSYSRNLNFKAHSGTKINKATIQFYSGSSRKYYTRTIYKPKNIYYAPPKFYAL